MADPDYVSDPAGSLQLLAEEVVLDLPAVEQLLIAAAHAAAAGVGLSCGITYVARYGVVTVASSDERANAVDEIQYNAGAGPCLEALHTGSVVRVDDQATDIRWDRYRDLALQAGVRSSLSLPLLEADRAIGALNVYSSQVGPLPADQEAAALVAATQLTGVLQAVRSLAQGLLRDPHAAHALQVRHELDIATGIVMMRHGCSELRARAMLTERAAAEDMAVQDVVRRTIASGNSGSEATP